MSQKHNGHLNGGLRSTLLAACEDLGCGLGKLTVLATQHDPFRVDTPARRRDGEWLAVQAERLGLGERTIHLRGLHYMLVSGDAVKPDGLPYTNTDDDWEWLQNDAAKAARWLGYMPFEQIVDARNTPPTVLEFEEPHPHPVIFAGVEVEIPDADELEPRVDTKDFVGVQPYKLVLFGEKTSLGEVLAPVAQLRKADLYLPAGEISDTLLHRMARVGADDGRPMVVLCFSDCDPSGWQMPISIARKLQGFQALEFPWLDFQVRRVALTPDHVRTYGLPSTPLKETEKRAEDWIAAMDVEQTEIDALAALQPVLLRRIALQAIRPFFDTSLARRVRKARRAWLEQAQARLDEQLDQEALARIREEAAEKLAELREEIDAINDALDLDAGEFELPGIVVPEPELNGDHGLPLIDSGWSWVDQTLALKASKGYQD